jgi:hypothetical protein
MTEDSVVTPRDRRGAGARYPWLRRLSIIYQASAAIVVLYAGFSVLMLLSGGVGPHTEGKESPPDVLAIVQIVLSAFVAFMTLVGLAEGIKLLLEIADGIRPPALEAGTQQALVRETIEPGDGRE